MRNGKAAAPERWRDIPGFGGKYQASTEGRIRRINPENGKDFYLTPYVHNRAGGDCRRTLRVHLVKPDGRRVERSVIKLVAETFFDVPEGKRAVHKNGVSTDNSIRNVVFMNDMELGKRFGRDSNRRPVVRIDAAGEITACYSSARAAARENYVSHQTVRDRCNGKIKNEFSLDGFSFRWDD